MQVKTFRFLTLLSFVLIVCTSCRTSAKYATTNDKYIPMYGKTTHQEPQKLSKSIVGRGTKNADQLTAFFLFNNSNSDRSSILRLARLYIAEAGIEGINSDVAFVQMCLETGFLTFTGLVSPEMHNYCGLGAIDAAHPGEWFPNEQTGVRAHIQHLHAYGTTGQLQQVLVDTRYEFVHPRGKAPEIFQLAGTWAADTNYGDKLDRLLSLLAPY